MIHLPGFGIRTRLLYKSSPLKICMLLAALQGYHESAALDSSWAAHEFASQASIRRLEGAFITQPGTRTAMETQEKDKMLARIARMAHEKVFLAHFIPLAVDAAIKAVEFSGGNYQLVHESGVCDASETINAKNLLDFPIPPCAIPIPDTERWSTRFKSGDIVAYTILSHDYPVSEALFKKRIPAKDSEVKLFLSLDERKKPKAFECVLTGITGVPGSSKLTISGKKESPLAEYKFYRSGRL